MEQQGGSGWFGGLQQQYGGHPAPHPYPQAHPQSHPHPSQWQGPPETQHFNRPPQMHPSQQQQQPPGHHQYQPGQQGFQAQGGYYGQPAGYYAPHQQQVPQGPAPVPPPHSQPHGMVYAHSEQVR